MPRPAQPPPAAEYAVSIPLSALLGSGAVTVVAPPPEMVSQRTVEATYGIPPRTFLEQVVPALRAAGAPVAAVGKLRLVARADLTAYLRNIGSAAPALEAPAAAGDATLAEIAAAAAAPSNTNSGRRRATR